MGGGTHHDLVQPVEKVGTIPRIDFRRLEPGQTLEIGRGPFPDTSIMTVQRPSTRIHPGVRSPIHQVFGKRKKNQNPLLYCICISWTMCDLDSIRSDLCATHGRGCHRLTPTLALSPAGLGPTSDSHNVLNSGSVGILPPFHLAYAVSSSPLAIRGQCCAMSMGTGPYSVFTRGSVPSDEEDGYHDPGISVIPTCRM